MSDRHPHDFASVVDNLHDGLYLVDRERRVTFWNKAAERLTGYTAAHVIGRRCSDNVLMHVDADGRLLCVDRCPLAQTMEDRMPREAVVFLHHRLGHRVPVSVRVTPLIGRDGSVVGGTELFHDTSDVEALRAKVASLERLSLIDPLTQLPNRRHLESEIEALLARQARTGERFGVVFLDIDRFKRLNDEAGHAFGDSTLRTVAQTLGGIIRPSDVMGRWGGDEFLGLFPGVREPQLHDIAQRLRRMVRASRVSLASIERIVTVSCGCTLSKPGDDAVELIRRTDALMYLSKQQGRDRVTSERAPSVRGPAYTMRPVVFAAY